MLITIDKIANRYHLLPSEVLARASTYDLQVMDTGIRYQDYQEKLKKGLIQKPKKELSVEQMQAMIKKVKK